MDTSTCANCAAPLTGPYCPQCGQHAHESSRTVGALFHDAWHVMTHVDGRFWQTLAALLFRPGRLTKEYFAEHRARYLPPVRLYLVLSLVFFAIYATGPHEGTILSGDFDEPPETASGTPAAAPGPTTDAIPDLARIRADARAAAAEAKKTGVPVIAMDDGKQVTLKPVNCDWVRSDWKWLEAPLRSVCVRNVADRGKSLKAAIAASFPKMMFALMPVIAFVMMLMYWWPRRLYVEHLVFFLHLHAAFYLIFLIELLLARLALVIPPLAYIGTFDKGVGVFYTIWYVFRAMRVFYGQGRALTLLKLLVLFFTYWIALALTMTVTIVLIALLH